MIRSHAAPFRAAIALVAITALLQPAVARAADLPDAIGNETLHRLRVHLLSPDDNVELRRITAHKDLLVCKTPCDELVTFRGSDEFVLDGSSLRRSLHFQLPERDGEAAFRVSPGYSAPQLAGGAVFAVGAATFMYSGIGFLTAARFSGVFCDGDPACIAGDQSRTRGYGTLALVGLAAAIIGGAYAIWGSPRTSIAPDSGGK